MIYDSTRKEILTLLSYSLKLTVPERKELAEKWVEIGKQYNITVFIHVGVTLQQYYYNSLYIF
jgi:hypothetical protein